MKKFLISLLLVGASLFTKAQLIGKMYVSDTIRTIENDVTREVVSTEFKIKFLENAEADMFYKGDSMRIKSLGMVAKQDFSDGGYIVCAFTVKNVSSENSFSLLLGLSPDRTVLYNVGIVKNNIRYIINISNK